MKRKIRKAKDTRLAEEKERERRAKTLQKETLDRKKAEQAKKRAEKLRRQKALVEARRAEQEADRAVTRARQELASVIRETGAARPSSRASGSSERKVQSIGVKQYSSTLATWISNQWQIPEMLKKNRNLKTTVALTIRRDGSIANLQIERKSGDPFFDQSVMKILQSTTSMPRFPGVVEESSLDYVLDFDPSGLIN
ncbi:MAG: TonB family protein [Thermodesulfobacteriota bacterium]|nr:TonB family protein [Thermodesulfobacteriota bacterium]